MGLLTSELDFDRSFCLAACATVSVTRLKLSGKLIPLPVVVIVGSGILSLFYTYVRRDAFVAVLSNTIALAAANFAVGLLSYTTQFWGASIPLRDGSFAEFDSALGFDWVASLVWLNSRPLLATVLRDAYLSLPFQILFLWIAQFVYSWELRVQRLFLATLLAAVITFAVAAVLPAFGAYHHFETLLDFDKVKIFLVVTNARLADLLNLRGSRPAIPIDDYQGIITFPSVHTVLGILFVWAAWPSLVMRWATIPVNGLLIKATPTFGAHYGADVIAGAGVAFVGIWAASSISRQIANSQQGISSSTPRFYEAGLTERIFSNPGQNSRPLSSPRLFGPFESPETEECDTNIVPT
jgi:PAP2 superfamily